MRRSQRLSSGPSSRYFQDDVAGLDALASLQPVSRKPKSGDRNSGSVELPFEDETESNTEDVQIQDFAGPTRLAPKRKGRPLKPATKKRPAAHEFENASSKKGRGRPAKAARSKKAEADSEESQSHSYDSDDHDSRVEFIPLPKLRDCGGVEYAAQTIHPNTMAFLADLKANNKRSWLKMRDPEFRRSLRDWDSFVATLTAKIIAADDTVPELPVKDVIFRIYRDVRFSQDPTPYKPHYSAAWSRTGRKGPYACYYVHCEPGNCFVGGGLWHPEKDALARLRANIDEQPHRWRRVLTNPAFRGAFLPGAKNTEASIIAAFCESNKENALKTKPQGFHSEHRDIELLKLRNYTVGQKVQDSDLTGSDAQNKIMTIVNPMVEFITFLNSIVMPDPNFDSDTSNGD